MKRINILKMFFIGGIFAALFSCNTLDVPPVDKIGDENVFTSEKGLDAYFARLYADMPVPQFIGGLLGGGYSFGFTGEVISGAANIAANSFDTWRNSAKVYDYTPIRNQCWFLQEFPKYSGKFDEKKINTWTAEVYFIRAFRYFEMVRIYGGVPIVDRVLNYPVESIEEVTKPRDKEKDCYDFIIRDLDESIKLFEAGVAGYKIKGRANVWTAYALKARVALYAASLAKYGSQYPSRYANFKNGICGIPASEATRYYTLAYDAATKVINGGQHSLYKGKWGAGTYNDILENFAYIFLADIGGTSPETIYAVHHETTGNSTAYMQNYLAPQYRGVTSGSVEWIGGPALDVVKRYEDIDGNLLATSMNFGTDANPVYYDNPLDVFAKAEPRMRASILVPGENTFRKETSPNGYILDVLYGVLPKGKLPNTSADILTDVLKGNNLTEVYAPDGPTESVYVAGKSGNGVFGTRTGFYLRKSQVPTLAQDQIVFGTGTQSPWIDLRYAEVLLTAAEAAVELGDASKKSEAGKYVDMIRERAGAKNRNYESTGAITLDAVRSEWQKEFFFENKLYWNEVRWRTMHTYNNKRWESVYPIYVWDKKQYYMKQHLVDNNAMSYGDLYYYMEIPAANLEQNKLLVRNHD